MKTEQYTLTLTPSGITLTPHPIWSSLFNRPHNRHQCHPLVEKYLLSLELKEGTTVIAKEVWVRIGLYCWCTHTKTPPTIVERVEAATTETLLQWADFYRTAINISSKT